MTIRKRVFLPIIAPILLGLSLIFFSVNTCQRFEPEGFLHVSSDTISSLGNGIFKLTGTIKNIGENEIDEHGFCWALSKSPLVDSTSIELGPRESKGTFTSTISDLSAKSVYYVRAYATTLAGTEYGEEMSFSTPDLPTITTTAISNITASSASGGGEVALDGGDSVTARGVCWSTSTDPTIADALSSNESGTGVFVSALSGLECSTTYFVRAYASNSAGTSYGAQVEFITSSCNTNLPTVLTTEISGITANSAVSGGEVSDEGVSAVNARGICWNTSANPTISNHPTSDGDGMGSFISSISGLSPATLYYVRAYATNAEGTAYGIERQFTTEEGSGGGAVTDIDGNEYNTVQICDQVWMAENLRVTRYSDGTDILLIEDDAAWGDKAIKAQAYCWYDNTLSYGDNYGAIYTWAGAMNGDNPSSMNPSGVQGACPDGWHIPSDAEWKTLEMCLGMSAVEANQSLGRGTDEGGKLKETGTEHWADPNTGATNSSGFTARGAGERYLTGTFRNLGSSTNFWTSTEQNSSQAWVRELGNRNSQIGRSYTEERYGFSVRCVEDGEVMTLPTVITAIVDNITRTTAEAGGNVTNNGGSSVSRGVCWSTSPDPDLDDVVISNGEGTGTYTSPISGLVCETTYYVRAYATNATGTAYGEQEEFQTLPCGEIPTVSTDSITNILDISAVGNANVTNDGGYSIDERGVCWNTSPMPTTSDFSSSNGAGNGPYTSIIDNLDPMTIYYVRAYAVNTLGTAYGEELEFFSGWNDTCTVSDIDGNKYATIQIGGQVWMAENLKTTSYADGSSLDFIEDSQIWANQISTTKAYCWYNNEIANRDIYGGLYTRNAILNGADASNLNPSGVQGVCPAGWHMPSDKEWGELEVTLGLDPLLVTAYQDRGTDEGGKLKEAGIDHWIDPNFGASNESGFTALPGGYRDVYAGYGHFKALNEGAYFWSCTSNNYTTFWRRMVHYSHSEVNRYIADWDWGFSVRCLSDADYEVP
jgi:uncharacterized protein (TIGR02145 family)